MTDGPVSNVMAARARQVGEAALRARPWLGAPYPGADLAARQLRDRRRSILIGLCLAGAVAFVLLAVFAAGAPRCEQPAASPDVRVGHRFRGNHQPLSQQSSDSAKAQFVKSITIERTSACPSSMHLMPRHRTLVFRREIQQPGQS